MARMSKKSAQSALVLVGTFRPQNEAWIRQRKLYNLPLPRCGKLAFHEKASALVLFAEGREPIAASIRFREVVDAKWLGENGYALSSRPHAEYYALYELIEAIDLSQTLTKTSEVFVSSSRCPSVKIDQSFYTKPYPRTGGRSMEHVFNCLKPYVTKWKSATTFDPVQDDFFASLFADGFKRPDINVQEKLIPTVFSNDHGTLFQGDSLLWLKSLPSSSVDLVFADPPYSIGKAKWDCFKSHEEYLCWCEEWISEVSRILTDAGTCYICGFSEILADVKYRTQKYFEGCRWIVWHYKNKANLGVDWGRSHESILHFRKKKTTRLNVDDIRIPYNAHTLRYPMRTQSETSAYGKSSQPPQWQPNALGAKPKDVFDIPTTCNGMGEKTPHPTQKPEELVRKLVLASSNVGGLVLDPFSGSGTTAVVAEQLHRRWLACDMNAQYNEWAKKRLSMVADHTIDYWISLDRETSKRREAIR